MCNISNGTLFTSPPTCISTSPPETNLGIFAEGNLLLSTSHLPLGVANEDHYFSAIKRISGVVAGDSSLQDRGVAHYLLSLLFSVVSLQFSFCFCVFYQKHQKIVILFFGC